MEERKSPKDMSVDWFYPEVEDGPIEYKLKIKDPNSVRFQQLVLVLYDTTVESCCTLSVGHTNEISTL